MIGILHVLNDGFLASFPLLLPFIQKELGLGFGSIGILSSVLGSAGVILALPSASIAKYFGGLRVLGIASVLYSIAFILTGFSYGIVLLALSFSIASIGFGIFHPISFALVAHGSTKKDIGKKMGNFTAIGDIGKIGIASVTTFLVASLGWRETAFMYGIVPLSIVAILSLSYHKSFKDNDESRLKEKSNIHGLRYSNDFILAVITGSIDALASSSLFMFIPFLFIHRGIPSALLGSLSGAFFVGNMLGKVLIGKIVDRVGSIKVFIVSEICMAILLAAISLEASPFFIAVLAVMLGAVTKGTVPVINTLVTNSVPDRRLYEKAFGIVSFFGGIAGVVAPFVFGLVAERFGIIIVFQLSALFALLAIAPVSVNIIIKKKWVG